MILEFKWTTSRARDSYGYNLCTLRVDGKKVARCNGGVYDMKGTCLGIWIASAYGARLRRRIKKEFYGLTFHDPNYDPGKAIVGQDCMNRTIGGKDGCTVAEAEEAGVSAGLERYQAAYRASSKTPTKTHVLPSIDGGCGFSSVESIGNAIGLRFKYIPCRSKSLDMWEVSDKG